MEDSQDNYIYTLNNHYTITPGLYFNGSGEIRSFAWAGGITGSYVRLLGRN